MPNALVPRAQRRSLSRSPWGRLALALLAIPFSAGCSGAAPEPTSPAATATVEVAPVSGVAAPGDSKDPASELHGTGAEKDSHVEPPPPPGRTPPPNNPPPRSAGGPDKDADGIADANDLCPDIPEDRDGFEDADGCPDPDNDKDGILDVKDRCPNEPETVNGTDDEDGCPDGGVSKVRLVGDRIEIMEIVHFDFNKATIQKISYDLLNQVAKVVGDHPEITLLRVEGHTDSKGEDAFNLKLSQERANAVRNYLVKRGIKKSRLSPVGYGETRPVESNADEDGRSKNRRVEFVVEKRATP